MKKAAAQSEHYVSVGWCRQKMDEVVAPWKFTCATAYFLSVEAATNLSKLDPPSPHPSTPGKTHRRTLTEITFHQYYFKGPTADPSGRQFIDVGILDSLRPKIEIALAQVPVDPSCPFLV